VSNPTERQAPATPGVEAALRERLLSHHGGAPEVLRVAGGTNSPGIERLAEESGGEVDELLPVLVELCLETRPKLQGVRRRLIGGFDIVVLLGVLALVVLILRALLFVP